MPSVNISLSEKLKKYVESQIQSGDFSNVSEYFRSLVRDHQKKAAQDYLEHLLVEGLESGGDGPMTAGDWDELRQTARRRASTNSKVQRGQKKST
jgi:antitoxin ParD1/3/4